MYISIAALAASFACAQAFKDTSPFVLFSSSPLPESLKDLSKAQLQSRTEVLENTKRFLKTCPTDFYYIHTQPQVSSSLLRSHSPHLQKALESPGVKARYTVSEVPGLEARDGDDLAAFLKRECGAVIGYGYGIGEEWDLPVVFRQQGIAESSSLAERIGELESDDSLFHTGALGRFEGMEGLGYTVIYLSTPIEGVLEEGEPLYEAVFDEAVHMELKRELGARKGNDSQDVPDLRPLFEKYTFLSPGLFMGFLVGIILLAILYVGISGVSSLEVSYGAFDKEMGPAAHKKQQ
jgi:hypothetical protein